MHTVKAHISTFTEGLRGLAVFGIRLIAEVNHGVCNKEEYTSAAYCTAKLSNKPGWSFSVCLLPPPLF